MSLLKNRSLSFKLVLLFLLTGVAMVFVLRLSSGGSIIQRFEKTLQPHLYQYFKYMNKEIGTPPNLETAQRLSHSLNVKIVINGPDIQWSSDGIFPNTSQFRFRPHANHRNDEHLYQGGRYKHHFVFPHPWLMIHKH